MATPLNFRHLYYFWVVAKEGGMSRGADRLGMAVQTVSAQVRALEQELGHALFKPSGRALVLTEGGEAAMALAEQIFQLGEALPAAVREAATGLGLRLRVGISDGLPKLVVRHLLRPAVADTGARLLCHEDEFDRLLAELALHKLDALLADRAAPTNNPNLRLYSHKLGEAPLAQQFSRRLFEEGVFAMAIGYPTVAQGKARIRVMNSAAHSHSDIEIALETFSKVGRELGVIQ